MWLSWRGLLIWLACPPQGVEYEPDSKGKRSTDAAREADAVGGSAEAIKLAQTVFDRTSALTSAALIAACGGLTLFLRYHGGSLFE